MKKMKKLALLLAAALCVTSLSGCGGGSTQNSYTANNKEYVLGVSGPLTGGAAMYGQAVANAAQLAVDEINAAGGLNGIQFKFVATDDMHDATKVSTNYSSLLEGGMQASLGTVTTAPGLEFKNLSAEDNVFFLTPSASGDAIPTNPNGFQMCFADGNQGKVAAEFVNANFSGQTIGVMYKSDEAYSKGIFDQFKANLDASVTVVETSFSDANSTDFSTQIDTLKECEFIFMPTYYTPASLFMTQAKDTIPANAVYYGCDGFDGIDNIEGFDITAIPQAVTMLSHFNSKATDGPAKAFIDKYVEKYGAGTLNQFGAAAYDSVYAIYGAMEKAIAEGKKIPVTIGASELCEILKAQFTGGYTLANAVTGESISWDSTGYVNKTAIQYVIKEAN
ncbi:MAG: ABC transporter substrate-binding protein [Lachnospiraceae bacterium]|nr:ABC transporter substrate-binding protein [Lachnospiraceae bacterium]MBQ2404520.1 ABC transporter substrate-binding protein [Lachnospiraceae bacterium]MBQ2424963.1 ABC transporter substrate-binding protein [Lachnospiraceae bacterium]MBQ5598936.1 ABC transporter substrate-binding protein [Lachnospiraceae bacterium]MBQ5660637.1 ABC transporter substrate-binding protein [Lachnospiraceae bacterium]